MRNPKSGVSSRRSPERTGCSDPTQGEVETSDRSECGTTLINEPEDIPDTLNSRPYRWIVSFLYARYKDLFCHLFSHRVVGFQWLL